jgi:hypothetical protein
MRLHRGSPLWHLQEPGPHLPLGRRRMTVAVNLSRGAISSRRLVGVLVVAAMLLFARGAPAMAQTAPPACDPAIPAAAEFVGLPSAVRVGRRELFGFRQTFASDWDARLPIDVNMVDAAGRSFFNGRVRRFSRGSLYVTLELGDPQVEIRARYLEASPDGKTCTRTLMTRVAGIQRVYFPSRCYNFRRRPRNVIVACGDGNFQLRGMRWRGWERPVARGRGTALLNDCIPYCAEGTFHRLPVRVRLSGRRLCRNVERYVYTRISWRYGHRPSWLTRSSGTAPFPCRLYDL